MTERTGDLEQALIAHADRQTKALESIRGTVQLLMWIGLASAICLLALVALIR